VKVEMKSSSAMEIVAFPIAAPYLYIPCYSPKERKNREKVTKNFSFSSN
jgi:hypothetical protein